jgi:hypothetical protein
MPAIAAAPGAATGNAEDAESVAALFSFEDGINRVFTPTPTPAPAPTPRVFRLFSASAPRISRLGHEKGVDNSNKHGICFYTMYDRVSKRMPLTRGFTYFKKRI